MKTLLKLLFAATLSLLSLQAQAQLCTASATPISFGQYNPQSSANIDNTGTITVTCQAVVASLFIIYNVQLSTGSSGAYSQRKMLNGTTPMSYQLYTSSAHSIVWGDGSSGTQQVSDGYLLQLIGPVSKNYTVYGRVTGSQNVKAGAYTDTVTILITY
ncbi:spore coat U domain-containing protein [Herbaspirillum sp. alder98]|uniref:Csu type fimbrial protein n=1 Tax=Herbaspirillum sp. alder98 TaxID=2913096 RepID=UPI001CD81BF7|nr:spore coat U domain-containing protein [Herbaspirillum sp. alder98]MCA1324011.1 spore coat U domain-containing protein [Herbaspirillum sp. alder98]